MPRQAADRGALIMRGSVVVQLRQPRGIRAVGSQRAAKPRPGDFAVVDTGTRSPMLIRLTRALSRGGFTMFNHAVICSRVRRDGTVYVVEAMPGGAKENVWRYDDHDHLWSTGIVKTSREAGRAALKYVDRPHSWLDYAAIAAHASHVRALGLRRYIASSRHLIGSQLVDRAELDAGVHLFADRRWRGYVRPSDLADLILGVGELKPATRRGASAASAASGSRPAAGGSRSRSRRTSARSPR
jgi:hypothetical protein